MVAETKKHITEISEIERYWAPKVSSNLIRRLYLADARGIVDEERIDEVGYALYARCWTIYIVTERRCPECEAVMEHRLESHRKTFVCPQCGWKTTWGRYHRSYKGKRIHGGRAYPAFVRFLQEFRTARTPRDKLWAIDRVIHAVHATLGGGSSPGAQNLIEGTPEEVFSFLEELGYGDATRISEVRRKYIRQIEEGRVYAEAHRQRVAERRQRRERNEKDI